MLVALDQPPAPAAFEAWHLRGLGDFWAHMLVAEGAAEVAVDAPRLAIWDTAAVAVIVEEAGGTFDGRISSNGLLHDLAVRELAK